MFSVKSTADLLRKSSHIEFLKYDMIENKDLAFAIIFYWILSEIEAWMLRYNVMLYILFYLSFFCILFVFVGYFLFFSFFFLFVCLFFFWEGGGCFHLFFLYCFLLLVFIVSMVLFCFLLALITLFRNW